MFQQFAGMLPWGPSGIVNAEDERAMASALNNPYTYGAQYLHDAADQLDHGDECHEPNVFGFIPTETQVAAALAALNMQVMNTPEPVMDRTPTLAQLSQSLYSSAADLWREIAVADTEGWDV